MDLKLVEKRTVGGLDGWFTNFTIIHKCWFPGVTTGNSDSGGRGRPQDQIMRNAEPEHGACLGAAPQSQRSQAQITGALTARNPQQQAGRSTSPK